MDNSLRDKKEKIINRLLNQGQINQLEAQVLLGPNMDLDNTFYTEIKPVSDEMVEKFNEMLMNHFARIIPRKYLTPTVKPQKGLCSVNDVDTGIHPLNNIKFERTSLQGNFNEDIELHNYPFIDTTHSIGNKHINESEE
jgi:hypothetical protein